MPRFFVDTDFEVPSTLSLPDAVVRHVQVLRLKEGDALTLFNGRGGEYHAELTALGRRDAACRIVRFDPVSRESPLWLGLAQSVNSGDKMEFTLQKGVEMGVSVFQPLITERSIVRLSGDRADRRIARWQEIVIAACEQSGRNVIPEVRPLMTLKAWLADLPEADARLFLSPVGAARLTEIARPARSWLMAGPEGGFSGGEEAAALAAGFTPIRLGPRVLRSETAALATVSAMQTVWGDYTA